MKIEHIALWTQKLDELKVFYETYFGAVANDKYENPGKKFESYFLRFSSGARLELMRSPEVVDPSGAGELKPAGYTHLAFSVGSKEEVERLTAQLQNDGYPVVSLPRLTGDGYYESVILDPDGNRVEITI